MAEANVVVTPGTEVNPGMQITGTTPSAPNGGGEMGFGVVETDVPGFFTTSFDKNVVKYGWATAPLNTITRSVGYRATKSLKYGYWSLGMRESVTTLAMDSAYTIQAADVENPNAPELVTLKVANHKLYDVTDQITIKGFTRPKGSKTHQYMPLNARVSSVNRGDGTISVQFLNGEEGIVIDKDSKVIILGHAVAEGDARVTPHAATPTPTYQYMQKYMTSAAVTNEYLEAQKEANYGLADLVSMNSQQFIEDIEKSNIWGVRSSTVDPETNATTWTSAGVIQQMLEGGAHVISIPKNTVSDEAIMTMMTDVFIGNTGSTNRYLFTGSEFFKSIMLQKDIAKQVNMNEPVRKFEYDWSRIRFGSYTLLQTPHPLFDKFDCGNMGMVIDLKYLERHVFRAMTEDQLDLMAIGVKDSKEIRCVEISSMLLKYPQCHALIFIEDAAA